MPRGGGGGGGGLDPCIKYSAVGCQFTCTGKGVKNYSANQRTVNKYMTT